MGNSEPKRISSRAPDIHPNRPLAEVGGEEEKPIQVIKNCILDEANAIVSAGMVLKIGDLVKLVLQKNAFKDTPFQKAIIDLIQQGFFVRKTEVVEDIVQDLVDGKRIADRSKLTRDNILDHPLRKKIHDLIREEPGVTLKDFHKFGKSNTTILHHLNKLLHFEMVRFRIIERTRAFFPMDSIADLDFYLFFSRKEPYHQLIGLLEQKRTWRLTELSRVLGKHHSTIQKQLGSLVKYGVVRKSGRTRNKSYHLQF
ncbi:MAG: hypothetical protein ACTSU5_10710 [Promethearchaeota archaeon]